MCWRRKKKKKKAASWIRYLCICFTDLRMCRREWQQIEWRGLRKHVTCCYQRLTNISCWNYLSDERKRERDFVLTEIQQQNLPISREGDAEVPSK